MPECNECGGWVSKTYLRVLAPSDADAEACPECAGRLGGWEVYL